MLGMKVFLKCVETLWRDRTKSKDTGAVIILKNPLVYVVSLYLVVSQSLVPPFLRACHIFLYRLDLMLKWQLVYGAGGTSLRTRAG